MINPLLELLFYALAYGGLFMILFGLAVTLADVIGRARR